MPSLLSAGSNAQGQLGHGSTNDSHSFQRCSFLDCEPGTLPPGTSRVICLTGGANHTVVLLEIADGPQTRRELWGCGSGLKGQLGPTFLPPMYPGASSSVFRPVMLPLEQHGLVGYSFKTVCASWETTYVVLTFPGKGDVLLSMGANDFGVLGIGTYSLESPKGNVHVVSFDHIKVDGLNLKSDTVAFLDIAAGQRHIAARLRVTLTDNTTRSILVGWGTSRHGQLGDVSDAKRVSRPFICRPKLISTSDDIIGLALGIQHTVFLHASKRVSGIGANRKGQLSNVDAPNNVRCTACTWNGTYTVVDDDAGKWCILSTGSNTHGQLGHRSILNNDIPSDTPRPVKFPNRAKLLSLKGIACGSEHVLSLLSSDAKANTEVWGWGWNEHGNLGLGMTEDVQEPIQLYPQRSDEALNISGIWAGCGTSWLYAME